MGGFGSLGQYLAAGGGGKSPGMGTLSGLSNLFQNKLFLQFLAGAGADLMQGTGGQNTLNNLNTSIANQNYIKLLSGMLSGKIPEGASVTHTDTGSTFKVPHAAHSALTAPEGETPSAEPAATPGQTTSLVNQPEVIPNPFVSGLSNVSASDLAGLNPEMISQALQFKMAQEQIANKRLTDVADMLYKNATLGLHERGLVNEERKTDIDERNSARQFLALAMKDDRPALIQEFEYAKQLGFKGDLSEFKNPETTTEWKNYLQAKEGGYKKTFFEYQKELRASGATRISLGEKVAEKLALSDVEARTQLSNPKELQSAIDKSLEGINDVDTRVKLLTGTPQERSNIINTQAIKTIEERITIGKGKIDWTRSGPEGRNFVWYVTWPNGDTEKITHAKYD